MKPLTIKQRTISLTILAVVFLLFAPLIVLYSLGYTLDGNMSFQKTGGIFIQSNIASASVFVDGEFLKNNGIFIRNTLIQDLVPNKTYKIEINKDGYQSWVKEIYVYPSIVSEGTVLMLPKVFDLREIYKFIDKEGNATSTPLVKTQTKATNPEFISVSELFASSTKSSKVSVPVFASSTLNPNVRQKSKIENFFEDLEIKNSEKLKNLIVKGEEISWLDKGNIKLYWTDEIISIPYYYCGGIERTCVNSITLDWGDEIKRFDYLPGRHDVWIVLTSHGIYAVEVDGRTQRNIQNIYIGENLDFRMTQTDRLMIKEGTKFFEIDL